MFSSSTRRASARGGAFSRKNYKKTQKHTNQQLQKGSGLFSTTPKTYTNVKYGKSGFTTPVLTCLQCKNNVFRHHKVVTESRMRAAVLNDDFFGKKVNNFVCFKCGFTMVYSGDITYSSSK
jgi:predicted nucleic-acid-binding Zn-ribbon protein